MIAVKLPVAGRDENYLKRPAGAWLCTMGHVRGKVMSNGFSGRAKPLVVETPPCPLRSSNASVQTSRLFTISEVSWNKIVR